MRVQVGVDITEPVVKNVYINCDYLEPCKITLKYDSLKNFCYFCGCLSHVDKQYPEKIEGIENKDLVEEMQALRGFDASLRAKQPSPKLPHELFQ